MDHTWCRTNISCFDLILIVFTIVSTFYRTWKAVWVKDKGPGWQQQQRTSWDILSTSSSLLLMQSLGIKKALLSLYPSSLTQLQVYTKILLLDVSSVRVFTLNPIVLFLCWILWSICIIIHSSVFNMSWEKRNYFQVRACKFSLLKRVFIIEKCGNNFFCLYSSVPQKVIHLSVGTWTIGWVVHEIILVICICTLKKC